MKKALVIFLGILLFWGCSKSLTQVIQLGSKNIQKQKDYLYFENDTVKITYSFWAKNGIMAFQIYNKSNSDLYLNWEKSSFIANSQKYNYWDDKTKISSSNVYVSKNTSGYYNNFGSGYSTSTVVKDEKISFIPPKSFIFRFTYVLNPEKFFTISDNATKVYIKRDDSQPRSTVKNIYYFSESYTAENSPFKYRNYLTFSFAEDFTTKFSINNEFYVSRAIEFENRLNESFLKTSNDSFFKIISSNNQHK